MDSKPGKPVFNRVVSLKDTWAKSKTEAAPAPATAKKEQPAAPAARDSAPKRGRAEARAELRAKTPSLVERYDRYQQKSGLSAEEANLLTGELALANYFDEALAAHPSAKSVAKWLLNDLLGLTSSDALATLPLMSGLRPLRGLGGPGTRRPNGRQDLARRLGS